MKRSFLFFGLIAIAIAAGICLRRYLTNPEPITPPIIKNASPNASFTAAELSELMNHFSKDKIAGQCEDKGFQIFIHGIEGQKTYYFYNVVDKEHNHDEAACIDDMEEKIIFSDTAKCLTYTIKNRANYLDFISYLKRNAQEMPVPGSTFPEYKYDTLYVLNNCIFIAHGHSIEFKGSSIFLFPKSHLDSFAKNTNRKTKELPVGYIATVNVKLYIKMDDGTFWLDLGKTLPWKTKVKIIEKEGQYIYCYYTDGKGLPDSSWIQKNDIVFQRPNIPVVYKEDVY